MTQVDRRVALVIGNALYEKAKQLSNPARDALKIAATLRDLGFDCADPVIDADWNRLAESLAAFYANASGAGLAVLFYAGHSVQVDQINYLLPIDADLRTRLSLYRHGFSLDEMLSAIKARVAIVLLDACRDNPFGDDFLADEIASTRSVQIRPKGPVGVQLDADVGVFFSTSKGQWAADFYRTTDSKSSQHSPFSAALLEHLKSAAPFQDIATKVTGRCFELTEGRQRPWLLSSFLNAVELRPTPEPLPLPQPPSVAETPLSPPVPPPLARDATLQLQRPVPSVPRRRAAQISIGVVAGAVIVAAAVAALTSPDVRCRLGFACTAPTSHLIAFGDDVADALRQPPAAGVAGDTAPGRTPSQTLAAITAYAGELKGRTILLSSGLNNDNGAFGFVRQQLEALTARQARVILLGSDARLAPSQCDRSLRLVARDMQADFLATQTDAGPLSASALLDAAQAIAAKPAGGTTASIPYHHMSAPPNDGTQSWIYLGRRSGAAWQARALDVPPTFEPNCYLPETDPKKGVYHVQGDARRIYSGAFAESPDAEGAWPPVERSLPIGTEVHLRSLNLWDSPEGDWWATLAQGPGSLIARIGLIDDADGAMRQSVTAEAATFLRSPSSTDAERRRLMTALVRLVSAPSSAGLSVKGFAGAFSLLAQVDRTVWRSDGWTTLRANARRALADLAIQIANNKVNLDGQAQQALDQARDTLDLNTSPGAITIDFSNVATGGTLTSTKAGMVKALLEQLGWKVLGLDGGPATSQSAKGQQEVRFSNGADAQLALSLSADLVAAGVPQAHPPVQTSGGGERLAVWLSQPALGSPPWSLVKPAAAWCFQRQDRISDGGAYSVRCHRDQQTCMGVRAEDLGEKSSPCLFMPFLDEVQWKPQPGGTKDSWYQWLDQPMPPPFPQLP